MKRDAAPAASRPAASRGGGPKPLITAALGVAVVITLMGLGVGGGSGGTGTVQTDREVGAPPPTTGKSMPKSTRPPRPTLPVLPAAVDDAAVSQFAVAHAPALVRSEGNATVEEDIERRAAAMLLKAAVTGDPKVSSSLREKLRDNALELRRKYADTLAVLPPPTSFEQPSKEQLQGAAKSHAYRDEVCYFVLTGSRSHDERVQGLHYTLGEGGANTRVRWISDTGDMLIRPFVPRSAFEDHVCRERLAEDTQNKGCRYQRNFYRALDAIHAVAYAAIGAAGDVEPLSLRDRVDEQGGRANETTLPELRDAFSRCAWFVKLSDDTVVLREHLEWVLGRLAAERDPGTVPTIAGKVERRSEYQFLSGGHPVAFSRAALKRWATRGGAGSQCEGTILDHGPAKLKKFWWWADDVLMSFCMLHDGGFGIRDLGGAISTTRLELTALPAALWKRVSVMPNGVDALSNRSAPRPGVVASSVLPVSYHTYPYASPRQMFSLWHWLHPSPPTTNAP